MEGFLLAIGFVGLTFALLSKWTKSGSLVAVGSFYLYFFLLGIENWVPFTLFTLGILLIIFEFLIPGFGFVGILGGILLFLGLYYTTENLFLALRDISMAVVSSAVVITFLIRSGSVTGRLSKFVLQTNLSSKNETIAESSTIHLTVGVKGTSYTPLRPSGKAIFGDENSPLYDVLSAEGFIPSDTAIVIEKIQGSNIFVRKQLLKGEE